MQTVVDAFTPRLVVLPRHAISSSSWPTLSSEPLLPDLLQVRRLLPPPRLRARPHPAENRLPPGSGRKGPLYLRAEAEENRIAIKFDGWLPAEKPTDAFTKKWTGLINIASGNVTCLFPRDTGSIPGADGDLPRDGRNTPQFAHRVAARVAAAAPARPLPPARSTVTGPDAPTRVLARIPPGAGPGQLLPACSVQTGAVAS